MTLNGTAENEKMYVLLINFNTWGTRHRRCGSKQAGRAPGKSDIWAELQVNL